MEFGNYALKEQVFAAGPSAFYRGRNTLLGHEVLVRRLSIDPTREESVRETFFREQRHGASLAHPHIQRPLDVFEADGYLWSVHELRTTNPTQGVVDAEGPLQLSDAARMGSQVADALDYMHARGFVHGKVTPGNVLVDDRGEAVVINLVKSADLAAGVWPLRPVVLGFSPFSAPEEFRGERPTECSDVYGLAATIVFWLTQRWPRGGNGSEEAIERARDGAPLVDLAGLRPDLPPVLRKALLSALAADPGERHGSAASLGSLLVETWQRLAAEIPSGFQPGALLHPRGALDEVEIVGRHGAGAFGVVLRATAPGRDAPLAVKALKPEHRDDVDARERFVREARAMQPIEHPNVVRIQGVGEELGTPYVVMDFIAGPDLGAVLAREGRLEACRAARLAAGVARGLAAIHEEGIVHRDLKPHNVLLSPGERPIIADFGVARRLDATRLTMTGHLVGTPAYMAPEQFGTAPSTPAVDLYALGAILHEMLTGHVPFPSRNTLDAIRATLESAPPELPDSVPAPLREITHQLLSKDPDARGADAVTIADILAGIADPVCADQRKP